MNPSCNQSPRRGRRGGRDCGPRGAAVDQADQHSGLSRHRRPPDQPLGVGGPVYEMLNRGTLTRDALSAAGIAATDISASNGNRPRDQRGAASAAARSRRWAAVPFGCPARVLTPRLYSARIPSAKARRILLPQASQRLSLADLLSLNLTACPLVPLSACETSFTELHDPSDECLRVANTIFGALPV